MSAEENYGCPDVRRSSALPPPLPPGAIEAICDFASKTPLASYNWDDRGVAPIGYTTGMAVAWSTVVRKYLAGDAAVREMALANSGNADTDVLAWYADVFDDLDMDNSRDGLDTLRHLMVLLHGLGMRESSGRHCEGRDMSADNVSSDTAEAGLFQMSWNMETCSDYMQQIFDQYAGGSDLCALHVFDDDVSCGADDWECYGSGAGYEYQMLAKSCPQFAVETALLGLRKRRQHWGPINRFEAEVTTEADQMFLAIERMISANIEQV